MTGSVTIEPDRDGRAGHALIRVGGAGRFTAPVDFRIRRDDYDDGVFGLHGWQVADELLKPDVQMADGDDLLLLVGPWIVQHVVSGVYHFAIPAARIETTLFWPDLPLLADPSSNMVAEPARAARRAEPAPRPQIQRQMPGAAPPRDASPLTQPIAAAPVPVPPSEPAGTPRKTGAPEPPAGKSNRWIALAVILLLLVAGGGYYGYRTLYPPPIEVAERGRPVEPPAPPPAHPPVAVVPPPNQVPSIPPPSESDLSRMSAAEALRSGATPEALLREGLRRMQAESGHRGDALLLMQGAADRDYPRAHAALGRLYDPNSPHPAEMQSDARQAALHYRAAEQGGDTSVAAPREALKHYLEQQAQRNDLYAH